MIMIVDNVYEYMENFFMISINNNEEIDIPSIMLGKNDGDQIINYLQQPQSETVKVFISFPQFPKSQTIEYEYWFDAMNSPSYQFLQQFYQFHMEMQDQLLFYPHYQIVQCDSCMNEGFQSREENCLSGGRYCAPDPDGPMTGQDAVLEIIRQLCIHSIDPINWWKYVIKYSQMCLIESTGMNCHNQIISILNLNNSQIEQCISQSFTDNDQEINDNTILANEFLINQQQSIRIRPLLQINNQKYNGSLRVLTFIQNNDTAAEEVFDTDHFGPLQAICRTFIDQNIPQLCQQIMIGYMDKNKLDETTNFFDAWIIWIIVIGASILWTVLVLLWYKRMVKIQPNIEIIKQFNEQEKSLKDQ